MDLDGNGQLDLLIASKEGAFVQWGGREPNRFSEPSRCELTVLRASVLSLGGHHRVDSCTVQMWMELDKPRRLALIEVNSHQWNVLHVLNLDAQDLFASQGSDLWLASLAEQSLAHWELDGDGEAKETFVLPLKALDLQMGDWNADGMEDLMVNSPTLGLGVLWGDGNLENSGEIQWIPESVGCQKWLFCHTERAAPRLRALHAISGKVAEWEWTNDSNWNGLPHQPDGLNWHMNEDYYASDWRDDGRLMLIHQRLSHSILVTVQEEKGFLKRHAVLATESIHSVDFLDFSEDGFMDFVFFDVERRALVVLVQYVQGGFGFPGGENALYAAQNFWENPGNEGIGASPIWAMLPKAHLMHFEESWTPEDVAIRQLIHHAGVSYAVADSCVLALMPKTNWILPSEQPRVLDGPVEWQQELRVQLPQVQSHGAPHPAENGVVSIPAGHWSHLVFSRSKNLRTELYLNGELVARGTGEDVDFDHRKVLLGAHYGIKWNNHYAGLLDEVEVIHGVLTPEEIVDRLKKQSIAPNNYTVVAVSFEPDEDGQPIDEVTSRPFLSKGNWSFDDGVRGRGMRFDGETACLFLDADIPETDVTYSIWLNPDRGLDSRRIEGFFSAYGMYNTSLSLVHRNQDLPLAKTMDVFEVQRQSVPESGELRFWGLRRLWVGQSGQIYVWEKESWRAISTPPKGFRTGTSTNSNISCVLEGQLLFHGHEEGIMYSFDLETEQWGLPIQLPESLADVTWSASTSAGQFLVHGTADELSGWWRPKGTMELISVQPPPKLLHAEDQWIGAIQTLGKIQWTSMRGEVREIELDRGKEILTADYQVGFGFESWMKWIAGGVVMLFLLGRAVHHFARQNQRQSSASIQADDKEIRAMMRRLTRATGLVDTLALDELFELNDISSETTRRSHRSKWIRVINDWSMQNHGFACINRQKDPTDRRRVLYVLRFPKQDIAQMD